MDGISMGGWRGGLLCLGIASLGITATHAEDMVAPQVDVVARPEEASTQYLQSESSTASRIPIEIKETPYSVTVIPQRVMEEQDARVLADVLKNAASISQESNNAGRQGAFRSRGFLISDEFGYFIDGQPSFGLLDPPIELIERVEVLRGPASIQYGRAEPGGVVNLIRKRPTAGRLASIELSTGAFDYDRAQIDLGGRFADDGKFGYRLNVARERSGSFRDVVFLDKDVVGLALDAKLLDHLTLTLFADYTDRETPWDNGQMAINGRPADIPPSRFLELPWGQQSSHNRNFGYEIDWKVSPNWTVRNQYNYQDYDFDRHQAAKTPAANFATTGNFTVRETRLLTELQAHSWILDLVGDNELLGMRHRTVLGYHRVEQDRTLHQQVGAGNVYNSNIYNPASFVRLPLPMGAAPSQVNDNVYQGVYGEDFIGITRKLDLMLGVRYDRFSERSEFPSTGAASDLRENDAITPRAGIIYRPADPVSLYVSYSRGFLPGGRVTQGINIGELLDPQESEQTEAGVKTLWMDNRLGLNAAVYELTRQNIAFFDSTINYTTVVGKQVHRGVEFEAIGEITRAWNVMASYAYLDGEITEGINKGKSPNAAPRHSTRLWTSYAFGGEALHGVTVFGGAFRQSSIYGDPANTFMLEGWTRVDAGISYVHKIGARTAKVQLNVENVFDRNYYLGNGTNSIFPQPPRTWRLGIGIAL
ncbi:MAG TPA: TonB-dependent siderophore receptor [Burkholderiales bacterium]